MSIFSDASLERRGLVSTCCEAGAARRCRCRSRRPKHRKAGDLLGNPNFIVHLEFKLHRTAFFLWCWSKSEPPKRRWPPEPPIATAEASVMWRLLLITKALAHTACPRYILLSEQRSGTGFFLEKINAHPEVSFARAVEPLVVLGERVVLPKSALFVGYQKLDVGGGVRSSARLVPTRDRRAIAGRRRPGQLGAHGGGDRGRLSQPLRGAAGRRRGLQVDVRRPASAPRRLPTCPCAGRTRATASTTRASSSTCRCPGVRVPDCAHGGPRPPAVRAPPSPPRARRPSAHPPRPGAARAPASSTSSAGTSFAARSATPPTTSSGTPKRIRRRRPSSPPRAAT